MDCGERNSSLASFGAILGRAAGYFDGLLADRYTRHVSVRVMEHASQLDLASYEDPVSTTGWNVPVFRRPTALR